MTYVSGTRDLSSIIDGAGNTTNFGYDSTFHQVTSIVDPLGQRTTRTIAASTGALLTIKAPTGAVVTYTWASDQVTKITDALGNVTSFVYDGNRRLQTTINPAGEQTTVAYDLDARTVTTQAADGSYTTQVYD